MMNIKLCSICIAIALLLVTACSSDTVQPKQYSGFLHDYSKLAPHTTPSGAAVMRWIDPEMKISAYRQVYLQPSQYYPPPQPNPRLSAATLDEIRTYYDQALKRELAGALPIVSAPGQNTLIVRPAITGVSAETEGLKAYEVIPVALLAAAVSSASGIRDQDAVISTEVEFIDASNGKLVAQVVRKGTGKMLENDSQNLAAGDFKTVIDGWAKDMLDTYRQALAGK
jgi:hypothetical protein